jgi:hypothetical protein
MRMNLFRVEYENKVGRVFVCNVVGGSEPEVIQDIISQVGSIRVVSLSRGSEIHRITGTIRRWIVETSLMRDTTTKGKVGRPRKIDF